MGENKNTKKNVAKTNNSLIASLTLAGKEKEKDLTKQTSISESETVQNLINNPEEPVKEEPLMGANELPEKKDHVINAGIISEKEKLPEKNIGFAENKKNRYSQIIQGRDKKIKESVDKANILTDHRNMLKRIATAEGISMQDLLANILDDFRDNYSGEIKQSIKKLMS